MSYFYTYKMTHVDGHFYLGRRQSTVLPEIDVYWGSGTLIWDLYKAQGFYPQNVMSDMPGPVDWQKQILINAQDVEQNKVNERDLIKEHRQNPLCLNRTHSSLIKKNIEAQLDKELIALHKKRYYLEYRQKQAGNCNAHFLSRLSDKQLNKLYCEIEIQMSNVVQELENRVKLSYRV